MEGVQNGKRLTWQVLVISACGYTVPGNVKDNVCTVERTEAKKIEKGFLGLSSDILRAPNRYVNYLREIIIYHIPSVAFLQQHKEKNPKN